VLLATFVPPACRDAEPPPLHNRDLGDGELVLLPTAPVLHDPGITEGRADLHPFRELLLDEEPDADEAPAVAGADETDAVRSEIRELIDEYNDLVSEATVEELLDYYIEEQHEKLRNLFEAAIDATERCAEIRQELEARLPDAKDRIDAAVAVLERSVALRLPVDSVTVVSDAEVTGTIPSGAIVQACRFRLVDEDWYLEIPGLGDSAELGPATDARLAQYRGWLEGLRSGQAAPEAVLQEIEATANAAQAANVDKGAGGAAADSDSAEEAGETETVTPQEGEGTAPERVEPGGG